MDTPPPHVLGFTDVWKFWEDLCERHAPRNSTWLYILHPSPRQTSPTWQLLFRTQWENFQLSGLPHMVLRGFELFIPGGWRTESTNWRSFFAGVLITGALLFGVCIVYVLHIWSLVLAPHATASRKHMAAYV